MTQDWIRSERLRLRPWHEDDLDVFAALTADPQVVRYVGDGQPLDRAQTAYWLEQANRNRRRWGLGTHAIIERASDRPIGWAGLIHNDNAPAPMAAEIIYALAPDCWGRGYGSELVAALVDWAWQQRGLASLLATVDPDNAGSIRVLQRNGFVFEQIAEEADGAKTAYYWLGRG
ncbi:GNAT family N-acetyltransferase [Chitinimonas lacunae]|uniref:GNAT family N-acetyltransferase n=1 Tax=Chitinimonas lacunae TaxID=1963018 RepID=A0ABV8MVF5_9NEIS